MSLCTITLPWTELNYSPVQQLVGSRFATAECRVPLVQAGKSRRGGAQECGMHAYR